MTVTWSWKFEMELSAGVWTDCTRDVIVVDSSIDWDQGIRGIDPGNRVAGSGTLSLYLDNSEANSGSKLGYYSPGHTNCRTGFARGIAVRISYTSGGVTDYFRFYITNIKPSIGKFRERTTLVQAGDYIYLLSRMPLSKVPVQVNKRPDQIIAALHAAIATAPQNENLTVEPFTVFAYSLHDLKDEKTKILGVIQRVCASSGGDYFIDSDTTDGETVVYEDRVSRVLRSPVATFSNTLTDFEIEWQSDEVYDQVRVSYNPGRVDTSDVVLANIPSQITLAKGETRTVEMRIVDPNGRSNRLSALSFVDPLEAGVDYKFSSISGDGGSDLNASLGVSPDLTGSNTVSITLTNNASVTGYIEAGGLQVRGRAIYLYDALDIISGVANSENAISIDLPYVDNYYEAVSCADRWETRLSDSSLVKMDKAQFYADYDSTYMGYAQQGKINQSYLVTEDATGLSAKKYYIRHRKFRIEKGTLLVEWLGEPAETVSYIQLDTTDKLDSTKVLA